MLWNARDSRNQPGELLGRDVGERETDLQDSDPGQMCKCACTWSMRGSHSFPPGRGGLERLPGGGRRRKGRSFVLCKLGLNQNAPAAPSSDLSSISGDHCPCLTWAVNGIWSQPDWAQVPVLHQPAHSHDGPRFPTCPMGRSVVKVPPGLPPHLQA